MFFYRIATHQKCGRFSKCIVEALSVVMNTKVSSLLTSLSMIIGGVLIGTGYFYNLDYLLFSGVALVIVVTVAWVTQLSGFLGKHYLMI